MPVPPRTSAWSDGMALRIPESRRSAVLTVVHEYHPGGPLGFRKTKGGVESLFTGRACKHTFATIATNVSAARYDQAGGKPTITHSRTSQEACPKDQTNTLGSSSTKQQRDSPAQGRQRTHRFTCVVSAPQRLFQGTASSSTIAAVHGLWLRGHHTKTVFKN